MSNIQKYAPPPQLITRPDGQIIAATPNEPIHIALANSCADVSELRHLVKSGVTGSTTYGIAYHKKHNTTGEFATQLYAVFDMLAKAERDEGLKDKGFFESFFQAVKTNKDFHWLSAAHIALAIKMGVHGRFSDGGKVYGKIAVRHLIGWVYDFMNEWMSGSETDYNDHKAATFIADNRSPTTVRGIINKLRDGQD